MDFKHIEGRNAEKKVRLFTLSTCGWCRRTKKLLADMSFAYEYIDVDGLKGEARKEVIAELKKHNPRCSYPTIVIDDECVVGYNEDKIKELLRK